MTTHHTLTTAAASGTTISTDRAEPVEFNAFRDLASRLVRVPKKELDELRRRDDEARKG